jgi:type I restriction enzyme S subunit
MKTYEKYKDSGIEWIGEIPTDWNVARLRYRGKSIIGITYKPDEVSDETNGTLVLRSSNVQNGKLDFKDCVYVDKKIQESQLTKEGDILVCARNGSAHLVGKCAYIPKEWENVSFGAFMSIVRTNLDKFLFYYFNSQVFKGQKGLFATSTINQLTSNMLNNLDIPIPPTKEEQNAIANYLDKKTAEIDQLISEKKQLVELYQEEKTALINQAVTKGINPDVKLKDSGVEWLGDIPEHWKVKKLKHVKSKTKNAFVDGPFGSNLKTKHFIDNGDVYVIDSGFVTSGSFEFKRAFRTITEEHFKTVNRSECKADDIIIAKIGANFGMSGILPKLDKPSLVSGNSLKLSIDIDLYDVKYIHFQLLCLKWSGEIDLLVKGSAQPALSMGTMSELYFGIPEQKEEQNQIVEYIEKESAKINAKIDKARNYINLLTEYRTALISEVVTGKIKVID